MYKSSELIRVAVSDLKKVLASLKHEIDMHDWIRPEPNLCYVCLAGAVLINTLGYPDDKEIIGYQPDEVQDLMDKLDSLRWGNIEYFLGNDASTLPDHILTHQIDEFTYDDNGARFISQLELLATKLEKCNV